MEHLVILIMLIALFLLYRIAYPKQSVGKKENKVLPEKSKSLPDVIGKSRFVLPRRSKPLQTPATSQDSESEVEKAVIFAAENAENRKKVIPTEQLDEVFADKQNEANDDDELDIDIDDDDNEADIDLDAEEAEELARTLGQETIYADGVDFNDLQEVAKVVQEQPEELSERMANAIKALENTEMLERLTSGNENQMNWIKTVVGRNSEKEPPQAQDENFDAPDYGDFISDFV
jgi:hypothetical protein